MAAHEKVLQGKCIHSLLCVRVHVCYMVHVWKHACHSLHVEVGGQLCALPSELSPQFS